MEIVDSYTLSPGQCYYCGGNEAPTIDTGRDVQDHDYGNRIERIYVCFTCAGEMADMIGWVSPARSEVVRKRARNAEKAAAKHKAALDAAREFVVGAFSDAEDDELSEVSA